MSKDSCEDKLWLVEFTLSRAMIPSSPTPQLFLFPHSFTCNFVQTIFCIRTGIFHEGESFNRVGNWYKLCQVCDLDSHIGLEVGMSTAPKGLALSSVGLDSFPFHLPSEVGTSLLLTYESCTVTSIPWHLIKNIWDFCIFLLRIAVTGLAGSVWVEILAWEVKRL